MSEPWCAALMVVGLVLGFYFGCIWSEMKCHEKIELERSMMYRILEFHGWLGRIHVDDPGDA